MRKICVITGTRAEYGLLKPFIQLFHDSKKVQLQLIVTNMHLEEKYGYTYKEIEADGFVIDRKIPILEDCDDSSRGTVMAMSKALLGFAEAYAELKPQVVVVLGDRFEVLAAATAALIYNIPIAHLGGGDVSEGAYDDSIRHAITKMSHLHFCSTEVFRKRIIQMGEEPSRVFNTGSVGVSNIKEMQFIEKHKLENSIGFAIDENTILVTYHPVTLSDDKGISDIQALLDALRNKKDLRIIFTMPNSDTGGDAIREAILDFVKENPNRSCAHASLGAKRYLSTLHYVIAVVGNSSSGIIEVPSFGIPTLDIGDRQKGRLCAESVVHCGTSYDEIFQGLNKILSPEFREFASKVNNIYDGDENCAKQVVDIITNYPLDDLKQKKFYDL